MMKYFYLLLATLFSTAALKAQNTVQQKNLKGIVIDPLHNKPLRFCTITLLNATTKTSVKAGLTKEDGTFAFNIKCQPIILLVSSVGYSTKKISLDNNCEPVDLGQIILQQSSNQLKEVSVISAKPLVQQEVDRLSYDVKSDPDSRSVSVLDILRKVPLVTVDGADNIQLKGNSDFKIFINGKPSALLAHNPSDVLRAMPSINVDKIEVITIPPAKYDAEGLAGIINIITKRNTDQGYNGNLTARYNSVYGPNININGTLKKGKFGIVGYYGYNDQINQVTFLQRDQEFVSSGSVLNQFTSNSKHGRNNYGSAELSYEIDSLNLFYSNINYYNGKSYTSSSQNSLLQDQSNNRLQSYDLSNLGTDKNSGIDVSANYQRGFKKRKDQLLTISYRYSFSPDDLFNVIESYNGINFKNLNYYQENKSGLREQTAQIDYTQPLKHSLFETGLKAIFRNNFSDFSTSNFDPNENLYLIDTSQTNKFKYHQNVYSAYGSYLLKLSKWNIKGGLRIEHTQINANFISASSFVNEDYNNLIPSISVQRIFKSYTLNIGYTDRISRPGIFQLNPFVNQSNPLFISYGNPELVPVVNHTFSLGYSSFHKVQVNMSMGYAFSNNTIESISTYLNNDITVTTYQNIGKNKNLNYNLNLSYPISNKISISLNGTIAHLWLHGTSNGFYYNNMGFQDNVSTNVNYKIADNWRAGFNAFYYSPILTLQRRLSPYFYSSYSVSKDFLRKKLNLSIFINNPYNKYQTTKSYTTSSDFKQTNYNKNYYAIYNANLTYKFGRLSSLIRKNQHSINNDDLSGK